MSTLGFQPRVTDSERPGSLRESPRLSVIVPVHNGAGHLARCLEALGRSQYGQFEVIVVDDCSTDTTPQIAERYGAHCIRTPRTLGPGGARNLGAQHAGGDVLVFVDADVVIPPEGLSLIAGDFSGDPGLAAVFGSYDDSPPWTTFISQYKNLMHHYVHQVSNESAATFWTGCGAMRKSVFEEHGGFDAARYTVPSIEDIALGLDIARAGGRIRLDKRLAVKHLKRWTVRNLLRADILCRAVPWSQLILSTRHLPRDLNLTYASRVSSLLVGLLVAACVLLPFSLGGMVRIRPLPLLGVMALICLLLLWLNRDVYRFFARKRGCWFAAQAVVAHWAYYLYSGMTFAVFAVMHFVRLPFSSAGRASVGSS